MPSKKTTKPAKTDKADGKARPNASARTAPAAAAAAPVAGPSNAPVAGPSTAPVAGPSSAPAPQKDGLERLKSSNKRNMKAKAKPKNDRALYDVQKQTNYGFTNNTINTGDLKGSFRPGYGGQPFYASKKDNYGGAVVKSDYDSLVGQLSGSQAHEAKLAQEMLDGTTFSTSDNKTKRAAADLVQLTQVIEAHKKRHPGADKMARASFRKIADGKSTFKGEFNRKDGNFVPARAKKGGSKYGGQEAMRAALDQSRPKDKAKQSEIVTKGVRDTLGYLSDSSEEEDG